MEKIIIVSTYPCHKERKVHLPFILDLIPIQRFDRKCPVCKTEWIIDARQISRKPGIVVNILEWQIVDYG